MGWTLLFLKDMHPGRSAVKKGEYPVVSLRLLSKMTQFQWNGQTKYLKLTFFPLHCKNREDYPEIEVG
jgi:hypothetical protein